MSRVPSSTRGYPHPLKGPGTQIQSFLWNYLESQKVPELNGHVPFLGYERSISPGISGIKCLVLQSRDFFFFIRFPQDIGHKARLLLQ